MSDVIPHSPHLQKHHANMQELHIDTPEGLQQLCGLIQKSPWLALDTEFMRESTYYPRFCLLQVCNGEIAASVDPIILKDLSPLLEIIYDENIMKVFHAGRQDLEIFHYLWGRLPTPLFDTQPAAELAGLGNQIGYARLVHTLLDHQLEKGHTRTDWSKRPLHPDQLRYALDDVIYLRKIYLKLQESLGERQDDEALQEAFAQLADPATYLIPPEHAWLRIRTRKYLQDDQLAVLQALAGWRESEARRADKPKGWILKNDVLIELSRRQPKKSEHLKHIRGLTPGIIQRRGKHLVKLIEEALELPEAQWPVEKKRM